MCRESAQINYYYLGLHKSKKKEAQASSRNANILSLVQNWVDTGAGGPCHCLNMLYMALICLQMDSFAWTLGNSMTFPLGIVKSLFLVIQKLYALHKKPVTETQREVKQKKLYWIRVLAEETSPTWLHVLTAVLRLCRLIEVNHRALLMISLQRPLMVCHLSVGVPACYLQSSSWLRERPQRHKKKKNL